MLIAALLCSLLCFYFGIQHLRAAYAESLWFKREYHLSAARTDFLVGAIFGWIAIYHAYLI